jgi:hypothetical protein
MASEKRILKRCGPELRTSYRFSLTYATEQALRVFKIKFWLVIKDGELGLSFNNVKCGIDLLLSGFHVKEMENRYTLVGLSDKCACGSNLFIAGHSGWLHWFDGERPTLDVWPDVSSYSPSELYPAHDLKLKTGEQAFLYSSRHPKTVQRHFHWMAENGVDGAFLQRFAEQCQPGQEHGIRRLRDEVGQHVRDAAEKEGRVFAIMYVFCYRICLVFLIGAPMILGMMCLVSQRIGFNTSCNAIGFISSAIYAFLIVPTISRRRVGL